MMEGTKGRGSEKEGGGTTRKDGSWTGGSRYIKRES